MWFNLNLWQSPYDVFICCFIELNDFLFVGSMMTSPSKMDWMMNLVAKFIHLIHRKSCFWYVFAKVQFIRRDRHGWSPISLKMQCMMILNSHLRQYYVLLPKQKVPWILNWGLSAQIVHIRTHKYLHTPNSIPAFFFDNCNHIRWMHAYSDYEFQMNH